MKKILTACLILTLVLALAAGCSSGDDVGSVRPEDSGKEEPAAPDEPCTTHEYGDWSVTVPATCDAGGKEQRTCKNCGAAQSRDIPHLEHNFVTKPGYAPDCELDGLSDGIHCSYCGLVTEAQTVIPAPGHQYGEWTVGETPTCGNTGYDLRSCSECGNIETIQTPALGHEYGEWSVTREPSCGEDGIRERVCSKCGRHDTEAIPAENAGDHSFGPWFVDAEPTCSEEGRRVRTCRNCYQNEIEVIPATGEHNFDPATGRCACGEELTVMDCLTFRAEGGGTYYVCTGLSCRHVHEEIVIPASYNGKPVKEVTPSTTGFAWCKVEVLVVMEGIERINASAFRLQEELRAVYLPSTLNYIGTWAFTACEKLEYVEIPNSDWLAIPDYGRSEVVDMSDPAMAAEHLRYAGNIRFER